MSLFDTVLTKSPKKSNFDLSHTTSFSAMYGKLYPILNQVVIPGDEWNINPASLVRTLPMASPANIDVDIRIETFFVPYRILMNQREYEKKMSQAYLSKEDKAGKDLPPFPYVKIAAIHDESGKEIEKNLYAAMQNPNSLANYLGMSLQLQVFDKTNTVTPVSMFPFLAYNKIVDDYYINPELQDPYIDDYQDVRLGNFANGHSFDPTDDPQFVNLFLLKNRLYRNDLYTSCFQAPQLGSPVRVPVQGLSFSIEDFRQANAIQKWKELGLRAGIKRYVDLLLGYFGVSNGDASLQRAQYLGGYTQKLMTNSVDSTAEANGEPLASLGANGMSAGNGNIHFKAKEHGIVMAMFSITPRPSYAYGINHAFNIIEPTQLPWPQFSNLGEEPIYASQLNGVLDNQKPVFGYNQRYMNYKQIPSTVHGELVYGNLSYWSNARHLGKNVAIDNKFCQVDREAENRIYADTSEDAQNFICTVHYDIKATRPISFSSTPMLG